MAAVPKALFTWFLFLVFIILLVLRIDQKVEWNWFIIFIPQWVLDTAVIVYLIVNLVMHFWSLFSQQVDRNGMTKTKKYILLACCLLKLSFQVLLCLHLEDFDIGMYYVFIPFWILFIAGLVNNFRVLISHSSYR